MKRILFLLLFLWPLLAFGANPPYEAFLGTNGITIRSNPPQGRIIIAPPVGTITNFFGTANIFTNFGALHQSGDLRLLGVTADTMLEVDGLFNVQGVLSRFLVNNFFAMNITNILAASGIAIGTNGGALWITNTAAGGAAGFADLLWTNQPAGRIRPVTFTNRVEIQRSLTIGTNSETFSGPPGTNDFLFAYRDILKAEDYNPKIEFGVFSNNVYSIIEGVLSRDQAVWRMTHLNENVHTSSARIGADAPGGVLVITDTNTVIQFAVVETNIFYNGIAYQYPNAQGGVNTVLTNNGAGKLGWQTIAGTGAGSGGGDSLWSSNSGYIYLTSYPTNVSFNPSNAGPAVAGPANDERNLTNFVFRTSVRRIGGTNKLFQIWNGGASAFTVSDQGIMIGSTNYIPVPQAAIDIAYDTAFGVDPSRHDILLSSYNSIVGYSGNTISGVETNKAFNSLIANKEGNGFIQFDQVVGGGAYTNFDMYLLVQDAANTLITPFQIDPDFSLSPTGYIFGSTMRITNTQMLLSLQNSNFPVFAVDGVGDMRLIKKVPYLWPSANAAGVLNNDGAGTLSWSGGSGTNFDSIRITNQVLYVPQEFNGSNGVSAVILTNNLDVHLGTWKKMTNVVGTNLVFHLSNLVESTSFIQTFYGNGGYTNTVSYRIPGGGTGTNIWWYGETNGSFDFQVSPGHSVTVNGFVDSQTNIVMAWSTTANLPKLNFFAINGWISNLFNTNITFINGTGSNFLSTNIFVRVGGGSSNAAVGGTYAVNSTPIETAGAAETNLLTHSIAANSLTNLHDRLLIRASGRFVANVNSKQLKLIYGTTTILDTTAQAANGGAWVIEAEIIRTGNSAQSANAEYHGTAEALFTTASAIGMAENNGIANTIKITGTAPTANGDITNRTLTVEYRRAP